MVKKGIANLDLSKASGPDFIPVVILKNNMCLKESCFPDCWKVSLMDAVFKNVGERAAAKNYRPVSLLSVFI